MTIAVDATSTSPEFRDTGAGASNPTTWTHTPSGTPAAIWVGITQAAITGADMITAVSYGGVTMSRIPTNGFAQDLVSEVGAAYQYELLSGIPAGAQTVSITFDNSTNPMKKAVAVSMTSATGKVKRAASGKIEGDVADPKVPMDSGTDVALRLFAMYNGQDAIAGITDDSGTTRILGEKLSQGPYCRVWGYQTTPASGATSPGFTATLDDCAMVGAAYAEAPATSGAPYAGGGFYP